MQEATMEVMQNQPIRGLISDNDLPKAGLIHQSSIICNKCAAHHFQIERYYVLTSKFRGTDCLFSPIIISLKKSIAQPWSTLVGAGSSSNLRPKHPFFGIRRKLIPTSLYIR